MESRERAEGDKEKDAETKLGKMQKIGRREEETQCKQKNEKKERKQGEEETQIKESKWRKAYKWQSDKLHLQPSCCRGRPSVLPHHSLC